MTGFKIKAIHVFLSTDSEGNEGVISIRKGNAWYPLIGADEERLKSMMEMAKKLNRITEQEMLLVRFTVRENIASITRNGFSCEESATVTKEQWDSIEGEIPE